MHQIHVKTQTNESVIYLGDGVLQTRLPSLIQGNDCFVVTDSNVFALYNPLFEQYFKNANVFVLPYGEENKNFLSLQRILEQMTGAGLKRTSKLFAIGGGVIGDIAGLAASLYMRGISCVQIPTTLLSQVDSSVGGKTAVDLGGVKNVVGAFYQPQEVLIDPSFLHTLPAREIKCGMGEIVKYAALDGDIFDKVASNTDKLANLPFLSGLTMECVAYKAGVVQRDEKETGERKCLNVGHTTGHAIELNHNLSHGESVLYGMAIETQIAINYGVCESGYGKQLLDIIKQALQVQPQPMVDFSNVKQDCQKAKSDKKNTGDGEIKMSVAKNKNEWAILSLPFDEYCQAVENAVSQLQFFSSK